MWFTGVFWEDFRLGAGLALFLAVAFYVLDLIAFAQGAGFSFSEGFWSEYWSHFMADGSRFFPLSWAPFLGLWIAVMGKFAIWLISFDNWLIRILVFLVGAPLFLFLGALSMFLGGWVAEGVWRLLSITTGP